MLVEWLGENVLEESDEAPDAVLRIRPMQQEMQCDEFVLDLSCLDTFIQLNRAIRKVEHD